MKIKDDITKTNNAFRKFTKSGGVQNSKRRCSKDLLDRQTKIHGDASDAVYSRASRFGVPGHTHKKILMHMHMQLRLTYH